MRIDGVEVKVNVDPGQTDFAIQTLQLKDVPAWNIYFVEDVTMHLHSCTPLLDNHLIVRARVKPKGKDDVTVKIRPGRRSQLSSSWLSVTQRSVDGLDSELKIEQDWAGSRRTLSISFRTERPAGLIAAAVKDVGSVGTLFTRDQKRFIDECCGAPFNLDTLNVLPSVSARRFPAFEVPGPVNSRLSVRAERWTIDQLDFLELSIATTDALVAEAGEAALRAHLSGMGILLADGEPKTTQVMQLLVRQAAGRPQL